MSTKKVNVLYNGKNISLNIELNEDNLYNSFLDIFRQQFNETDPDLNKFKLTTINTSIPYLLIDEYNIPSIIKEKIENNEPLKLLLIKENEPEEMKNDMEDIFFCGYYKQPPIYEDKFNDDFFILDENSKNISTKNNDNIINNKEEENSEEEEKINRILTNSFNKNIISSAKKDENFENENDIENLDLNENLRLSTLGNININSIMTNDEKNDDKLEKEIPKNNTYNEEKDIYNDNKPLMPVIPLNIPKNIFKSEKCSLCGNHMTTFKYICGICDNTSLCENCENIHLHPCFKYKTKLLSNLADTYKYIDKYYNFKIPLDSKKMTKLIRKEYNLKIVPMTDLEFSARPNKVIDIPLKVLNLSDEKVNSSQFIILIKNNKLININYKVDKAFTIKPDDEHKIKLLCRTPAVKCKEKINIEIYSSELKIRMSSRLGFDLEIEINNDKEDEGLNRELNNDKYAIFHSKEHKKIILNLVNSNEFWTYDLKKVCQVLKDNKWDTKKAIDILNGRE
jgi:hypothetical protein